MTEPLEPVDGTSVVQRHSRTKTDRRYSDEEVAEILKLAVEGGGALVHRSSEGLSLREIQAIAEEVGIDALRVESAALSLDVVESQRSVPLLGTPYAPQYETRVEGTISQEDFPDILATIRRVMGRHGIPDEKFGALGVSLGGGPALGVPIVLLADSYPASASGVGATGRRRTGSNGCWSNSRQTSAQPPVAGRTSGPSQAAITRSQSPPRNRLTAN